MTANEHGFVYIASTRLYSKEGLYKVGSTNNIPRRLRELSRNSSNPEPFFISFYVRCEDRKTAKILENMVHNYLDEDNFRYFSNREFFKTETAVPIIRYIFEAADDLDIPIVERKYDKSIDFLNYAPSPLASDRLMELDDIAGAAYRRAAREFSELLFLFFVEEIGINKCQESDNQISYKKLLEFTGNLYETLDDALGSNYVEVCIPIEQVFFDSIALTYGRDAEEKFHDKLQEGYKEELANNSIFPPKTIAQIKEEIKKYKERRRRN
ncbi:MAG: GIY-YIG nuclease family protein [Rhodospirillaceae bacterium]|nr:GIY-YIG nuclease family protein [Rhodospirillaceae bacterium]